jgi:hypothetical protein
MPCRPSPEEESWAAQEALEQAERLRQQRVVTLALLRRLLIGAGLDPDVVVRLVRLAEIPPEPVVMVDGDERAHAVRVRQQAEVHLCIARFALMQMVSLLPWRIKAPLADEIAQERRDHLRHRLDDCAAEAATLAQRIAELTGPQGSSAEVAALRQELERLQSLTPDQLLANRDFSAGVPCPRCHRSLPELPGVTPAQRVEIAAAIDRGDTIAAITLIRRLTGLGLAEGKRYVSCPHGYGQRGFQVVPPVTGLSPFRCPRCGESLPRLPNLTVRLIDHLQVSFVRCPHPLPSSES